MASTSSTPPAASNSTTRLYVGNLHFSVDEYSLIKIFSRFGKVTKVDYLFHKTGEKRGKPRGYAFVEMNKPEDAHKALQKLHDLPLRGRNLVVTYASQMREDSGSGGRQASALVGDRRTTLSMVKSTGKKPQGAAAQIAALEAKLAQMKKSAPAEDDDQGGGSSKHSSRPECSRTASPAMVEGSVEAEDRERLKESLKVAAAASLAGLPPKPTVL